VAKARELTLDVGQAERHNVDVCFPSRRRGVEIYVDGDLVKPVQLRTTTTGTERYEVRIGLSEPHTVRIERRGKRRPTFQAYIDGWPAPDGRAALRAARRQDAVKKARGKPGGRRTTNRVGGYLFALVVVLLVVLGVAVFVRNQVNDASIASHGRAITARIVGTEHDTDDDGANDYLYVFVPACQCQVRVATDNPAAHPKGSTIPVLYDTTDPTNARPLVDGNSTIWTWVLDVFFLGVAAIGLFLVYGLAKPDFGEHWFRRGEAKKGSSIAP
jgi:hypothetical protein